MVNMALLKLMPSFKDYLWGGHRLADEYNKKYYVEILAESWELSCHPDGPSVIANGKYAGKTLKEFIDSEGKEVLGENCRRFRDFPILVKFIDAKDNLSIQVHPDNNYALKNEGQYGKTEMWYVMDAAEDAYLYFGFKKEISKEEFAERIENDTLLEVLKAVPVHKGDVFFIESGTMLDVAKRTPSSNPSGCYPHIADCDYFTVDKLNLDGGILSKAEGEVSNKSFVCIMFLDGEGSISCDGETVQFQKGDTVFLAAGSGSYIIEGKCDALVTTLEPAISWVSFLKNNYIACLFIKYWF